MLINSFWWYPLSHPLRQNCDESCVSHLKKLLSTKFNSLYLEINRLLDFNKINWITSSHFGIRSLFQHFVQTFGRHSVYKRNKTNNNFNKNIYLFIPMATFFLQPVLFAPTPYLPHPHYNKIKNKT